MQYMDRRVTAWASAIALVALMTLVAPLPASARSNGRTDGGGGCGGCHGPSATGTLGVTVSGPLTVLPNSTTTYTLTIDSGLAGGALSVVTDAGSLAVVATEVNTQLMSGAITHVDANNPGPTGSLGDWSYDFYLIAPASVGTTITLAFSGMTFNGDLGSSSADLYNTGTFQVTTAIPEPATGLLMGLGLGILGIAGRRRRLS
jgi:hypothetical protein